MIDPKSAALFVVSGFLLALLAGSLGAAPDKTSGMALMSASVDVNGALLASSGVVSATRTSAGIYDIAFGRDLGACTCTASFGLKGGTYSTGLQNFISATCPYGGATNARVLTYVSGALFDAPFQLIAFCPT